MYDYVQQLFAGHSLSPHPEGPSWEPALIWTHVVADAIIGICYFSIPLVIARFMVQRRDVQFGWVAWLFAAFILACGATHFLSIAMLWIPFYGIEGLVKLVTAIVSVVTAVTVWRLLPRALAVPSPTQLQRVNAELRDRIAERDAALVELERVGQERRAAEDMLRQAQKMEAIGQLTAGVAHDFNNLLTVIVGSVDRAVRLADDPARVRQSLETALVGADAAARVTDQLLSFSRRQPLMNTRQDLNAIVDAMSAMLRRTLGDTVRLSTFLADEVPPVLVDRNQTESAILNLVINARDAIVADGGPGGHVRIETAAGDRRTTAILRVADDGPGMTTAVRDRAFEPFFTTKKLGEGSGLGLSQVYGFVKQSNGDVAIDTAPGGGTTVSLILPSHRAQTAEAA